MTHNLHAALAETRMAELRRTTTGARGRHITPRVTERPPVLEPAGRDPFLDGLIGPRADHTPAHDRA